VSESEIVCVCVREIKRERKRGVGERKGVYDPTFMG
jgi:hypothetical protein